MVPPSTAVAAILSLHRSAGNRAVAGLIGRAKASRALVQRESYDETARKLNKLDIAHTFTPKRTELLGLLKTYSDAIEAGNHAAAFRVATKLKDGIEQFQTRLGSDGFLKSRQDEDATALESLKAWLDQIAGAHEAVEAKGRPAAILEDRQAGKLLYADPPLTVQAAESMLDQLRKGERPAGAALKTHGEMAEALTGDPTQREWGFGTIGSEPTAEAVIIPGQPDVTPFSDFPYITPRAHSHPEKRPGPAQKGGPTPPRSKKAEVSVDEAMNAWSAFGMDLLPSKQDIVVAWEHKTPHKVFVHYKYSAADRMIINPAASQRDVTTLPWINFEITDMREDDNAKTTGAKPLLFTLTLRAGATELRYENRKTSEMMGS